MGVFSTFSVIQLCKTDILIGEKKTLGFDQSWTDPPSALLFIPMSRNTASHARHPRSLTERIAT